MFKNLIFIVALLFISTLVAQTTDTVIQEGIIQIDSSPEIEKLVAKKIKYNTTNIIEKYRIQLFYGSENGAIKIQSKFRTLFPNTATNLEFDSPNWKVKIGNYITRLKADKQLQKIILEFRDAIIIEPKKKS